ncbi:hypothetical protein Plec18167_007281 [Paecilomyces lecythidis]|uniref:Peptidase S59 domain-containing protein n=1 Tax=Paecilomyces lecythidis TaxID=3004212 RepID=A0ABR3X5E9_9EURO
MSFGGFGGFGQNNQQSSGFGTGSGFGGSGTGGGFGSTSSPFGSTNTTGGGLFGSTSGGFGSGGGFGSTQNQSNSLFGSQNRTTGFGSTPATSGGSLFGGGTATSGGTGFGGFGSTSNTGGFGSSNTAGGLFGNKTGGFGSSTGTSGFGTGGTTGGFGTGAATTGFGAAAGSAFQGSIPPCEGTGGTPFNPVTEKDSGSSVTNHYQSITYMQPYSRYSFEELRLADYQQGRRYGNGSGQAGAFGTSAFGGSGFGQQATSGFGGATSTPFGGAATSAPSAFGQTATTGGFGSTSTNPLFGAQKPATSLFGGSTTNTSQPSLFGGNTATTGGFGSNTGTTSGFGSGGSLFGSNNQQQQQQQNKPLFGGGTTGTGFGGGTGFGQQSTTSASNPFGSTTATASPFGGQQQTGTSAFGGFGQQNQTQQAGTGGGLFGGANQQQQKPSLFGSGTGTGTGLFGQNNQQSNTAGGLFGGNNQQTGTGGLFGGGAQQQEQKPSLFGGASTTGTSAFGGFGQQNQNQQTGTGGGLFGSTANQQQQKPSLFGSTATGGGLFGQSNTGAAQTGGSSLFGATQNQQPQAGGLGTSSLFGGSQNQQQQQQQSPAPGSLQASLLDGNPYGNQSIFSGLPGPNAPSPGPLATPLSSSMKQKQRTPLPVYKITPNAANRLITPPKRQGYGFSYSTYGSPSSTASTPNGLGGSLLGGGSIRGGSVNGSFGRSFGKSFSTSNLRKTFDPDNDSILAPGAFTPGSSRYSGGSLKRLTIDRSLRSDLFARPASTSSGAITNGDDAAHQGSKLKKRVSFDSEQEPNGAIQGAVVRAETESPEPTAEELGFLRSIRKNGQVNGVNGVKATTTETPSQPEMESVRGSELAVVPEAESPSTNGDSKLPFVPTADPQPGEYWMKPSRAELSKMSRDELKHVVGFTVGRQKCGQVTFDEPVDLTTVDIDQIFGGIVVIGVRSITVYPDDVHKPPMGKGLNVPSTLRIENSWPRGRDKKSPSPLTSGPLFDKHVDRLRKVHNTQFVAYEKDTGTWVFRVPHFTTYGLDYDDDDEGESLNQSTLSAAPDTPTPKAHSPANHDHTVGSEPTSSFSIDESFVGSMAGVDDDTFDFKKRKMVPGAFGNQMGTIEDEEMESEGETEESFLEDGSAGSTIEQDGDEDITESQQSIESEVGSDEDDEMEMAGSFPTPHRTAEQDHTTGSIMTDFEHTQRSVQPWGTPSKAQLDLSGDWADQLQRTISPRKQDRDALREIQANAFADKHLLDGAPKDKTTTDGRQKGFTTSIDLMNSLFQQPRKQGQPPAKKQNVQPQGLQWPYSKQPKTFATDSNELTEDDIAFHHSFKPRWGPMDSIICARNDMRHSLPEPGEPWEQGLSITSEGRDVVLLAFNKTPESEAMLETQREQSIVRRVDGVPFARLAKADLRQFIQLSAQADTERQIWQLANILFNDDIEDDISASVPARLRSRYAHRIKKDRLSRLWESIVRERHPKDLEKLDSAEERAVALLCSHRLDEACKTLVESGNLHLATLLAQIGRNATTRTDMQKQVESWRQHNVYSEMNEPIRALYELLAGNALRSEGKPNGALEDRASTFTFSERFGLDWFQAFGLRLWYCIAEDEPLEFAVSQFLRDITDGGEPAFPLPSYLEANREVARNNTDILGRESPLWVLLKVYAVAAGGADAAALPKMEFPAAVLPESVSGDRISNRLSFQLHHLVSVLVGQHDWIAVDNARADQLVWDYAWELSAVGQFEQAAFVLLHLSRAVDRERAVKDLLARFARMLPNPTTPEGAPDATWHYFTNDLQLPEAWLWVAKALYARDAGDAAAEADCLIRGKNWNDAHATFCRIVGPRTIIERDYATLEMLLSGFGDGPERKVRGWTNGGGVYDDFLRLVTAKGARKEPSRLKRLVGALVAMGEKISQGAGVEGLEERVAFREMSRVAAGWCVQEEGDAVALSDVLNLPLTGDARLQHTTELSRRYYSVVMAGAY